MKKTHHSISAGAALLLCCLLAVLVPLRGAAAPSDEASVEAVIRSLQEHWNRGDMTGYLERYEQTDSLALTFGNTVVEGWNALDALFRASYPDPERMGRFTIDRLDTRLVADDVAIAYGNFTHVFPHETIRGGFTHVLHRGATGRWLIVHERTSRGEVIATP